MAASTLIRPTTTRAVHLRITPRPSNIGESREILRLISQFGEVEYFKNLKYDSLSAPNAAIVIFRDEDAAKHCLKRSPIRFRMGKASLDITDREAQGNSDLASSTPGHERPIGDLTNTNSRIFQIQTNPARTHFRDQLDSAHFHGAFMVDGKSAAQQDLSKRVPTLGLSDINWRAAEKPWKVVGRERERDGAFRGSGRSKSLQEIYDEGER